MLYYIIYIINALGARFIVFVPDFIASVPIFMPSPQGLALPVGVAVGEGVVDNLLTAICIAVGHGNGVGVMTPSLLAVRGMMEELRGKMVEVRRLMVAARELMPEGIVKLISRCEIVIANRDIMISHRETVISNPETKMKPISVRMVAVGLRLVYALLFVCVSLILEYTTTRIYKKFCGFSGLCPLRPCVSDNISRASSRILPATPIRACLMAG